MVVCVDNFTSTPANFFIGRYIVPRMHQYVDGQPHGFFRAPLWGLPALTSPPLINAAEVVGAPSGAPPLRDYQTQAIECVIRQLRFHPRTWIEMPTGTGKSRVLRGLADRATKGRVLALAHTDILVRQLAESIGADGVIMAGQNDVGCQRMVGSVQTLRSHERLAQLIDTYESMGHISLLLVDEAHHATPENSYGDIITVLEAGSAKTVGVTATPIRQDGQEIEDVLGTPAFIRTILDMQHAGWLAPMRWQQLNVGLDLTKIAARAGDYDPALLEPELIAATDAVVLACAPLIADGRPTVAYGVTVRHAQALAAAFDRHNIAAGVVWGEQKRAIRNDVLAGWRAGTLQVVCNVGVLTEGFDFPELSCVIVARPTRSQALYLQMIGRGLRKVEGKTTEIIDLGGNSNMTDPHQIILPDVAGIKSEAELDELVAQPTGVAQTETQTQKMASIKQQLSTRLVWRMMDDKLVCRLALDKIGVMDVNPISGLVRCDVVLTRGRGYSVDHQADHNAPCVLWRSPTEVAPRRAAKMAKESLAVHEQKSLSSSTAKWRDEPATEKQLNLLRRTAPTVWARTDASSLTKGEVAGLLDDIFTAPLIRKLYG